MHNLKYFFIVICLNVICSGSGSYISSFCAVLTKDGFDWPKEDYFIQANGSYSISAVCKCTYKSPSWRESNALNQYSLISHTFESIHEPKENEYLYNNLTNYTVREDTVLHCGNNAKQYAKAIFINIENSTASTKCSSVSPATSDMITTTNAPQTSPTFQPTSIIVIPSSSTSSSSGSITSQLTLSSTTTAAPIVTSSSSTSSRPSIHDSITTSVTPTIDSTTLSPAEAEKLKEDLNSSNQRNIYLGVAAGVLLLATIVLSMILLRITVQRGRRHSGSGERHDDYNEAESTLRRCMQQ